MIGVPHPSRTAVIAEDEELGRVLLGESAKAVGLEPLVFDNGSAALEAASTHDVAIVLLDVDMPGLDGYSVCRQLREIERLSSIPIVMVTGHEDTSAIDRAFEAGATDYIAKPVNWALLPHRLAYILRNAASVRTLADREAKVRTLIEAIPDMLWVVSPGGEPLWTPSGRHGARNAQIPRPFHEVIPERHLVETLSCIRQTAQDGQPRKLDYRDPGAQSANRSYELRFTRCADDDVLVVRQDTSERTLAAERIERLAYYDSLTALPNRLLCIETAERWIMEASSHDHGIAVIYLALNGFKRINDTFGHSVGDKVLGRVAERLSQTLAALGPQPETISLARFGGDEFVILVRDSLVQSRAMSVAAACSAALSEPVHCNDLEFFATPSIGVSTYPNDGSDIETLLKHADTAMSRAKASGLCDPLLYTEAMSARLRDWHDLESRLRRAVRDELLDVRFQPKFRLQDNAIVGVEALARWYDEKYGEISPNRFVSIAEESGLIIDLGAWLVRTVCRQLKVWLDASIALPVAINISGKDIVYGDPARLIEEQMRTCDLPSELLEIELTESIFVSDSSAGRSNVQKLRDLGCRIALDDFGTGFSSLGYLTRFPPHRIKIDRSFIHDVDRSASGAAVVNSIVTLAQSLDLKVTAEGIERAGQLEWLRANGCHEGQGFLLARPMSAAALEAEFLRENPKQPPMDETLSQA